MIGGRPWRRTSLRVRLLVITLALLAVGLLVSSAVVIGMLRTHLVGRVDEQLRPITRLLARLHPEALGPMSSAEGRQVVRALTGGLDLIDGVHTVYLNADGTTGIGPADPARMPELPRLDAVTVAGLRGEPFETDDGDWRVMALPRTTAQLPADSSPAPPGSSVVVAATLSGVDSTVARLSVVCLFTAATLLSLLTAAGWYAVRAGLRPLRRIEETAAAIAGGDLSRRVPETASPSSEVGRLSASLNGMLGQIEEAFAARAESEARMRRFVADVSHELRTPLFGIKGFSELYRMGGLPEPDDVDRTMERIRRESGRLTGLVEDLLLLARLDEGQAVLPMDLAPMDLRALAADARHDLRGLDSSRPITLTGVEGGAPASAPVLADEARLRQVVTNLVGNAVQHTAPGTPIRLGVGTEGGEAVLVIADEGPGLTAEQAARVFDRFYRVDGSRGRGAGGGAGLGLAIASSIVGAHGGRVELRTAPGAGAAFRVVLPAVTA
ncbi:sensor histidine kinase [Streptosporangium sp. KLBMP 9127]|nr:HAMP domain-containing histidine kinase [Streptosporangium sp. KLBMP 9127]